MADYDLNRDSYTQLYIAILRRAWFDAHGRDPGLAIEARTFLASEGAGDLVEELGGDRLALGRVIGQLPELQSEQLLLFELA